MRVWVWAAAGLAALCASGSVGAQERAVAPAANDRPVVHLCERGDYAEQALKRRHGAAPFATAAEVLAVSRGEAPRWSTPRCMNGLEYYRLDMALRRVEAERAQRKQAARLLARN